MLLGKPSLELTSIEAQPIILNERTVLFRGKSGLKIGESCSVEERHSLQMSFLSETNSWIQLICHLVQLNLNKYECIAITSLKYSINHYL